MDPADSFAEYFWACDVCAYAATHRVYWAGYMDSGDDVPPPEQPGASDSQSLLDTLTRFVTEWGDNILDAETETGWETLRRNMRMNLANEERIRKVVGNAGLRPRPEVEVQFFHVGKTLGYFDN